MTIAELLLRPEDRPAATRIDPAPCYPRSRAALRPDPQIQHLAAALERHAATHPHAQPTVPNTLVRVARTHRHPNLPALRLFYSVDQAAVRFLWIEEWDEMEG